MPENWPPKGYSEPIRYQKNSKLIFAIALVTTGLFGFAVYSPIERAIEEYVNFVLSISTSSGMSTILIGIVGTIVATLGVHLLFQKVIIPIHERIHYWVGRLLNLNPVYGHEEGWIFTNPAVVALSTGIPVWKNLAMIIAPFTLIGAVSWIVVQFSGGLLAGLAAIVLWINSAASAQDLYHYFRLLRMDPGTLFANFERGDEIHIEYVLPENS